MTTVATLEPHEITDTRWRAHLRSAWVLATSSPDPSTQNGAIIVDDEDHLISVGWNTFPEGVAQTADRWERPAKYLRVEHAERNAIYRAAYLGASTTGATMVCGWAPCNECARAIIASGIRQLVTHRDAHELGGAHWEDSIAVAMGMLAEADVDVVFVEGSVGASPVRMNGALWTP